MQQTRSIADQFTPILQAARKSVALNQVELAQRLGLSQSRMAAMELNPSSIALDQLLAICSALQLALVVQTTPALEQRPASSLAW